MQKHVFAQSCEVIDAFFDGEITHGRNGRNSIYFNNNRVIYSYGEHFPLAIRNNHDPKLFIVNGDSWSNTTARQQSELRSEIERRNIPHCIIPFSALERAGIDPVTIEMIEKEEDKTIRLWRKDYKTGEKVLKPFHLMGSTLFKVDKHDDYYGENNDYHVRVVTSYWLSGLDETATDPWKSFFLVELVKPCETVEEAYESMKPAEVQEYERTNNMKAIRQGEFFFIPMPDSFKPPIAFVGKNVDLTHPTINSDWTNGEDTKYKWLNLSERSHRVSYGCITELGSLVVTHAKGYVRHARKEHKQLVLKNVWHKVCPNLVKSAYSAGGRID